MGRVEGRLANSLEGTHSVGGRITCSSSVCALQHHFGCALDRSQGILWIVNSVLIPVQRMGNNYEYDKIDLDGPAFRLVRLHRGESDEMISCTLFQAVLHQHDEVLPYEALSYTWGPMVGHHSITVNGQKMSVTANLYLALKSLRHSNSDRILWIDAVCIDQRNVKERNHQVAQMSWIYKQANRVIFFLGNATLATDAFMHCMQLLQLECSKYAYRPWTQDDLRWKKIWAVVQGKAQAFDDLPREGLENLLSRPWFRRVWILQEVANAKSAIVCCGNQTIAANIFAIAPIIFGVEPSVHCQSVIDIMPGPWRQTSWKSEQPCLYTLLLKFRETEATEPRDLIYALKAIAADSDSNSPILAPDYDKTEYSLVYDLVGFLFGVKCDAELSGVSTSVKGFIKDLENTKNRLLWASIKGAHIECLEGICWAPGVNIPEDAIELVAEHDLTGEMMNLLLASHSTEFKFTLTTFLKAVEKGTAPTIAVLEHYVNKQNATLALNEKLLAAARNQRHGSSLVHHFLSNNPKLDDCTHIAIVALNNKEHVVDIIQHLLDRGCHIATTDQLLNNALSRGCYEEVLKLLINGLLNDEHALDKMATNSAKEKSKSAEIARAFFRKQAKFLVRCASLNIQLFYIFRLSCQQLESYGYVFLEEFFLCAAEVFAELANELPSQQCQQFSLVHVVDAISSVLENSGVQIRITKAAFQAAINGSFGNEIIRLLAIAPHISIDVEAALGIVKLGSIPSVEKILLYQQGLFQRNASIVGEFRNWYFHNHTYIDKDKRQKYNWLNYAIKSQCYETSKLLLSFGADPNQEGADGQPALLVTDNSRIAALLLSYGANVDTRGPNDRTPLHWAVSRNKNYGLAELLLVCGADTDAADCYGEYPLDMAARFGNDTSLIRLLREYGAHKMKASPNSGLIQALLQEPLSPVPISISATVKGLLEEFGLAAKPNRWSRGDDCKTMELLSEDRGAEKKRSIMFRRIRSYFKDGK
jgi:hypothetical protein